MEQLVGVGESAAGLSISCAVFVEVDGVGFVPVGCHPVDAPFLGPIVARGELHIARSIVDSDGIAMAIRSSDGSSGRRCGGWQVWRSGSNTDIEETQVLRLICRVRPEDIPAIPRWCKSTSSNNETSMQ